MAKGRDNEPVSVLMWMLIILLTWLPCIGLVFVVVFALVGKNQTRKNYFRALIIWFLILATIWSTVMLLGFWPVIEQQAHRWIEQLAKPR